MLSTQFTLSGFAAVGIGAVLGAWSRWGLSIWLNPRHQVFPIGTFVANGIGALLIGAALAYFETRSSLSPALKLFAVTGFLGALTTFSTFSAEVLGMIQKGQFTWAVATTCSHVVGSVCLAALGYQLLRGA